jgi:hypothetical protein
VAEVTHVLSIPRLTLRHVGLGFSDELTSPKAMSAMGANHQVCEFTFVSGFAGWRASPAT